MRINNRIFAGDTLGEYDSEERALEVLDEIQKLLMGKDVMIFHNTELESYENMQQLYKHIKNNKWACVCNDAKIEYISPSTIVYEMPLK